MRPRGFESPLVHLLGLVYDACCLLAFVVLLGAGMVYASWECQETNPGKLASLPALGLVVFGNPLMGCSSLNFVVDSCR